MVTPALQAFPRVTNTYGSYQVTKALCASDSSVLSMMPLKQQFTALQSFQANFASLAKAIMSTTPVQQSIVWL